MDRGAWHGTGMGSHKFGHNGAANTFMVDRSKSLPYTLVRKILLLAGLRNRIFNRRPRRRRQCTRKNIPPAELFEYQSKHAIEISVSL